MLATKKCSMCKQEKPTTDFGRHSCKKDGLRAQCRVCNNVYFRNSYAMDGKRHIERVTSYMEANKESVSKRHSRYKKDNKHRYAMSQANRRASQLMATPVWADMQAISDIYLEAEYMQMEVDHIVPLNHRLVCGLHVPANLQLLTKSENRRKSNTFEAGY